MTDSPAFPPHTSPDFVHRFLAAQLAWRRDDGLRALFLLESLLDDYPWSAEALSLYGTVVSMTRHAFHPKAAYHLYEWLANRQVVTGRPAEINEGVERFRLMKGILRDWLANHNRTANPAYSGQVVAFDYSVYPYPEVTLPQWACVADVAGADGAMALEWTGLPGTLCCVNFDLSRGHCLQGRAWRNDPRLHFVQAAADSLPSPGQSFDVVVLSGILEHVAYPPRLVDEADRILRPGGLLLVQVPYGGTESLASSDPFRHHVGCVNPFTVYPAGNLIASHYVRYTGTPHNPHSWEGEVGDFVVAYEKLNHE